MEEAMAEIKAPGWAKKYPGLEDDWGNAIELFTRSMVSDTPGTYAPISVSMHTGPIPRDMSKDKVLAQIGWLGGSNKVYTIGDDPSQYESVFRPIYVCVGTWVELEPAKWGIKD